MGASLRVRFLTDPDLSEAFDIATQTWQHARGTSIASTACLRQFYSELAGARNWLQLAILELDGKPISFEYDLLYERVLYNLIQNAIRHTPNDGTITLTVRGKPNRVELVVADTGEGIRESDLPHVFDRFYRGEPARTRDSRVAAPGTGLGLAIAKGIVEAHGGTISAISTPGQGAAFHIVLPSSVASRSPSMAL